MFFTLFIKYWKPHGTFFRGAMRATYFKNYDGQYTLSIAGLILSLDTKPERDNIFDSEKRRRLEFMSR